MERQYKDSGIEWIGRIPREWKTVKGKNIFSQRKEKGNSDCTLLAATQKNGMYPQHLLEGVVKVSKDADLQQFKTVHINDYVISLRSFQGGFEMSQYEGVCSPAYQVFANHQSINHIYYKYLFKSDAFIQQINAFVLGIRDGKNIQYDDFSNMYLPVPPLPEQRRIADYLDEKCGVIDGLISLQEQMIQTLTDYKQSVITEAVTKGLNPNANLVPSGIDWIGNVPEGWKVCRFKNYITLIREKADNPNLFRINLENIQSYSGKYIETDSKYEGEGYLFKSGDVLFGKLRPYLAKVYAAESEGQAGGDFYVFRPSSKLTTSFLKYAILSDTFISIVDSSTYGIKMPRANWDIISNVYIEIPPLPEQQSIASYLDKKCSEIDSLIALKRQKMEMLKDYKKSIIYEAVTGKMNI